MATLIDARVMRSPLRLTDPGRPDAAVELGLRRLEIASEDGEAAWCRLSVVAPSASWPPEVGADSGPGVEMLLGLVADFLPVLDGRDAADVTRELLAGQPPDLAAMSSWRALLSRPPGGDADATAWAARALLDAGPAPAPLPSLVARVLAVLFEEGWEPRQTPAEPGTLVATVEPEDGWTLSARVDDAAGEVIVDLSLPIGPPSAGASDDRGGLVDFEVDDDGQLHARARVRTLPPLPSETVAGMIDAVLDAARALVDGAG